MPVLTSVREGSGLLLKTHMLMWGFSTRMRPATAPEPSKLPTRNMKTKKKRATRKRHWARSFHPPSLLNHRWTGTRGHHLLQKISRHARLERRKKLLSSNQLAKMQAIIRRCPIINHVHPRDKIINSSTPTWRGHYSCNGRGPDPSNLINCNCFQ